MLAHWQKMIVGKNPIDMTSPVTRVVAHVGLSVPWRIPSSPISEVKLTSTLTSYIVMSDCRDDLEVLAC